ncbi:MAG: DUF6713 family protein [Bacteroidota bacterium]
MSQHLFFYLGMSFLMMHEMDAIRCREWRIFPGLSYLKDQWGFPIFLFAHIPLFYWIFAELASSQTEGFIRGWNYFFLIHLGLHLLFLFHPKNEFKDWISWSIIGGAALCGALDLLLS